MIRNLILAAAALGLTSAAGAFPNEDADSKRLDAAPIVQKMHAANIAEIKMGGLAQKNAGSEGVRSYGSMLVDDHKKADVELLDAAARLGIRLTGAAGPGTGAERDAKVLGGDQDAAQHGRVDARTGSSTMPDKRDTKIPGADQDAAQKGSEARVSGETPDKRDLKVAGGNQDAARGRPELGEDHEKMMGEAHGKRAEMDKDKDEAMMESLRSLKGRSFDQQFLTMMVKDHGKVIDEVQAARRSMLSTEDLSQLIDKQLPALLKHRDAAQKLLNKIVPQARRAQ